MRHDSRLRRMKRLALLAALPTALLPFAASSRAEGPAVGPVHWPKVRSRVAHDPAVEARVEAMLRRMSIEQKVAQIVQGDIASIKPEDMARTHFGSILAGGNSAPGGVETAPPADKGDLPLLSEDKPAGPATAQGVLFGRGGLAEGAGWSSSHGLVAVRAIDRRAQEDARTFTVKPHGAFGIFASPTLDLSREATGQLSLIFEYRVDAPPTAAVDLQMNSGSVPIAGLLRASPVGKWQTAIVPLRCFVRRNVDMTKLDQPFNLVAEGSLTLSISDVRIDSAAVDQDRCGAP